MTEKQKHHPKSSPNIKKANDKKETLKNKKEHLREKRDCHIENRNELTSINLDFLKDQIGHEVKPGENIWRIIHEYAKNHGKKTISPNRLQNINITPGDKVYFTDEKVIIKYLDGGTKNISFEESFSCENNSKEEVNKKEIDSSKNTNHKQKEETDKKIISKSNNHDKEVNKDTNDKKEEKPKTQEVTNKDKEITSSNKNTNYKKEEKTDNNKKKTPREKKLDILKTEANKLQKGIKFQVISAIDSPLIKDIEAYINEVKIRKTHGAKVKELVGKYCKGSIIDENFLYCVIARESRFDEKAISPTGVKGLGQLTNDTVKTIININEAKLKNTPNASNFYITNEITKGVKRDEKGNYKIDIEKALLPINQIKLTISYLLYLENIFNNVTDKNFKTELIITAYNLGPGKTQEILDNYKGVKNWDGLKAALIRAVKNGEIKKTKKDEVFNYVSAVKENMKLASLK